MVLETKELFYETMEISPLKYFKQKLHSVLGLGTGGRNWSLHAFGNGTSKEESKKTQCHLSFEMEISPLKYFRQKLHSTSNSTSTLHPLYIHSTSALHPLYIHSTSALKTDGRGIDFDVTLRLSIDGR